MCFNMRGPVCIGARELCIYIYASGSCDLLGSLSNYDGNANENVTQKTNVTFLKLLRYYLNYFNLSNVAELSGS